jgi:hypothetical protein
LDSIEHIQGSTTNHTQVVESLERLLLGHAEKLKIPHMHLILTVPPWLPIRAPGLATLYQLQVIPCVSVKDRNGVEDEDGLKTLVRVLTIREPNWTQLLSAVALRKLALASGGYLRDYFRLLQALLVLARGTQIPVDDGLADVVIDKIRGDYQVVADDDIRWLARIATTRSAVLPQQAQLATLARFFDNMLVLHYKNRERWYDIHPLIRDEVLAKAKALDPA